MLPMNKGSKLPLTKGNVPLHEVRLELSWSPPQNSSRGSYDLDVSAFPLNSSGGGMLGSIVDESHICYWGQPQTPSMEHLKGDNRTGAGDGPDEVILVRFNHLPSNCDAIAIVGSIDKAVSRGQYFTDVKDASMKIFNNQTNELMGDCRLAELETGSTGCLFSTLRKVNNVWTVENVSQGYPGKELPDFFSLFGYQG